MQRQFTIDYGNGHLVTYEFCEGFDMHDSEDGTKQYLTLPNGPSYEFPTGYLDAISLELLDEDDAFMVWTGIAAGKYGLPTPPRLVTYRDLQWFFRKYPSDLKLGLKVLLDRNIAKAVLRHGRTHYDLTDPSEWKEVANHG